VEERWVNIYPTHISASIYNTREDAIMACTPTRVDTVKVTIEFER
jgi:hypothetical protein